MKKYKASIIVPVSNNYTILEYFLVNLKLSLNINQYQLIFVLDGPVNEEIIKILQIFVKTFPSASYHHLKHQSSYAHVNNYGRMFAQSDLLVFMNTDIIMEKNCLENMIASLKKNSVQAVQPLLIYPQNNRVQSAGHIFGDCFNRHALKGQLPTYPLVKKSSLRQALSLALCLIPCRIFDEVNGFDEYYYNGWEGLDLTLKITKKGYLCWYEAGAKAYHVEGGSRKKLCLDESQQAAHFWSIWGKSVKPDIIDIIKEQLSDNQIAANYVVYDFTTSRSWFFILNTLGISYQNIINKTVYSNEDSLDFFNVLSHQTLIYPGPLLFLVNSFNNITENSLWLKYRKHDRDIFFDLAGNAGTIKSIVCGN